jgi:Zn-dependent protease with chaperone function
VGLEFAPKSCQLGGVQSHSIRHEPNRKMNTSLQNEQDFLHGEQIHAIIAEEACFEQERWAVERARRVANRLQADRPEAKRLIVEIPWIDHFNAFTVPGRYIYIVRRLYQYLATDEHVAFVIAHEMAHHDLGHVSLTNGWAPELAALPGALEAAYVLRALRRLRVGSKQECDADRHGLDLCLAAGYNGWACLSLFDIIEQHALNFSAYEAVYGHDDGSLEENSENASLLTKTRLWVQDHVVGYLSLYDRRRMLADYLSNPAGRPKRAAEPVSVSERLRSMAASVRWPTLRPGAPRSPE